MDDRQILILFSQDPEKGMELLYIQYYTMLCSIASIKLDNSDLARDLVQELMAELWKGRDQLVNIDNLQAYLITAVKYKVIRFNKSRQHGTVQSLNTELIIPNTSDSDQLEYEELKSLINQTISSLPSRAKNCFLMNRDQNLTYKQIALKLGISPKTVDHHISHALKKLKKTLKEYRALSLF